MKKFFYSILFLLAFVGAVNAQVLPNDFYIYGQVTRTSDSSPVANKLVEVWRDTVNGAGGAYYATTTTNASGNYNFYITNGSIVGPNQIFKVKVIDCQNFANVQAVNNNQGTTDIQLVNFAICDNNNLCQAGFTTVINPPSLAVYFSNASTVTTGQINNWCWDFGDGQTSCNAPNISANHVYANAGTYIACLTIGTTAGCTSTYCDTVVVGCTNSFSVLYNSNGYLSLTGTHSGGTAPYTYQWNWGDGNGWETWAGQNGQHNYQNTGTYNVCFRVTSANGCVSESCQTIVVGGNCQTAFSTNPVNDSTFTFVPTSSGTGPFTYTWNFGDGGNQTSTGTITHQYTVPGVYTVCCYSQDQTGCVASYCQQVTVTMPCVASFTSQTNQNNNTVIFIGLLNNTYSNTTVFQWTFGDGTSGNFGPTIDHVYANPGTYTVCVTITDNGCTDSYCQQVTVGNACNAGFTSQFSNGNLAGTFVATINGQIVNNASYSWSWGDNSTGSGGPTNQHSYANAGSYVVCVYITYGSCTDSYCDTVVVGNVNNPCDGAFSYGSSFLGVYSFSPIQGGNGYSHLWTFGDGTSSTLEFPTHTYTANGNYTVCHTIFDNNGCQDTECQTISVTLNNSACQAYFYGTPVNNPNDLNVQFTDYSTSGNPNNPIIGWTWSFGDGSSSTLQNPAHDYTVAGTYVVCLTVWNNSGCQSQYCDSIVVGGGNTPNIISGTVYTSVNTPASVAYVFLLRFDYPNSQLVPEGADVTSNGGYLFSNVPNGDYVVKAALTPNDPLYAVRIPTYHTAAMLWNFGDVISINNNSYTTGDIYMIAAANNGGPGFIGGTVDWADTLRAATDFSGATVILQTIAGDNIAFAVADANGEYSFPNLAYGTYKLYADFPGYTGDPTFVTITPITDSIADAQVLLGPANLTGVEETSVINGISLYPNPTTDNTTLVVETTKTSQLSLTVVNMVGQVVGSQTINAYAGKNTVQVNTDNLAQGVYTIVLRDSKGVAKAQRLVKQ